MQAFSLPEMNFNLFIRSTKVQRSPAKAVEKRRREQEVDTEESAEQGQISPPPLQEAKKERIGKSPNFRENKQSAELPKDCADVAVEELEMNEESFLKKMELSMGKLLDEKFKT